MLGFTTIRRNCGRGWGDHVLKAVSKAGEGQRVGVAGGHAPSSAAGVPHQRRGQRRRAIRSTAGEDPDGAPVDRAGRQGAANGKLNAIGAVVAAEQDHVDELRRSVRAPVAACERRPQLVEAVGPCAAAALLGQRDGILQPAGLAREQLEVVIEPGARLELAVQALVTRDDPKTVGPYSSTRRRQMRFDVWRCLRGASTSASSHASISSRYAPSFGAGRDTATRFAGGSGDASAARTVLRCTP
jgi:hypothetical protein